MGRGAQSRDRSLPRTTTVSSGTIGRVRRRTCSGTYGAGGSGRGDAIVLSRSRALCGMDGAFAPSAQPTTTTASSTHSAISIVPPLTSHKHFPNRLLDPKQEEQNAPSRTPPSNTPASTAVKRFRIFYSSFPALLKIKHFSNTRVVRDQATCGF